MSTTETPTGTELFDGSQYEVPFPKVDNREVNELQLRLSGQLNLDRHNAEHVALVESLRLGRYVRFTVTANVAAKGQTIKATDEAEIVTHHVGLKLHGIEPTV